jgi:glycosyltransferase involved in cell wall biosynthesis
LAFHEVNELAECHHTLAWTEPPLKGGFWPPGLVSQLQRRCFPDLPREKLKTHPWPEIIRLASRTHRFPILTRWLRRRYDIQTVNRHFDEAVARRLPQIPDLTAVYGYFDTSLHTFRAAKKRGLRTLYELPTPYWKSVAHICDAERTRLPLWSSTLPSTESLSATAVQRDEELQLADLIIVPSHFVRESLELAPPFQGKVHVVPYGCPEPMAAPPTLNREPRTENREPLKLLFVGTLSQTKGLADLLEAIVPLGNQVCLTLAGSSPFPLSQIPSSVRQLGQLPHAALLAELPKHDLMVLPTLYEGLSLSLLEAMSAGLPVLTTPHSGLAGIVENGVQAILIPPSDPNTLRSHIRTLLEHPIQLSALSQASQNWAQSHTWSHYRQALQALVTQLLP